VSIPRTNQATADGAQAQLLEWLATADGRALLDFARDLPADTLTRLTLLRKQVSAARAAAAVELLELRARARARAKFADAEQMFFTREGLEQATGDAIAAHHAARLPEGVGVLDACCGIGGDARLLAARGPVVAVDQNPAAAHCTRLNIDRSAAGAHAALVACADATMLRLDRLKEREIHAAFFDPSRRAAGYAGRRRVRAAEEYAPPLRWLEALRAHVESVCVKVSPAVADESIAFPDVRVEFLSDRGECKEAVLWFGPPADSLPLPPRAAEPYFATVLRPGLSAATLAPFECAPLDSADVMEYLFEPDPAVIRAHLVPQIASVLSASAIEPGVAYLTSARLQETPFASAYRAVDALPFDRKHIQRRLRALGAHISVVKKRGVPFEPEEVRRALAPCGDRPLVLILLRRAGRAFAILSERVTSGQSEQDTAPLPS
jgi:hypothetical protein